MYVVRSIYVYAYTGNYSVCSKDYIYMSSGLGVTYIIVIAYVRCVHKHHEAHLIYTDTPFFTGHIPQVRDAVDKLTHGSSE